MPFRVLDLSSTPSDFKECISCGNQELKRLANQVICCKCGLILSADNRNKSRNGGVEANKISDPSFSNKQYYYPKNILQNGIIDNWWEIVKVSDSTEHNLAQGFAEITRIGLKLDLPIDLLKNSSRIYQKLAKKQSFKGLKITSIASAVLYISCKKEHYLMSLDKMAKVLEINKKEISNSYKFILKALNLKPTIIYPIQYLQSFSRMLKLSDENKIIIEKVLKTITEVKLTSGKNPAGIMTATIYISSILTGENITQRELSEVSGVTQTTIRNRYKEIMDHINIEIML